jgi:hypothetical protein
MAFWRGCYMPRRISWLISDSTCTWICDSKLTVVKISMAGEIIMSVAYGIDVLPSDDPYITLAHEAM